MDHSKCDELFQASKALLKKSGLVRWSRQAEAFVPMFPSTDDFKFEGYWKDEFHPVFGRYMAWVLFAVGAENLAKAACLCGRLVEWPNKKRVLKELEQLCIQECDKTRMLESYRLLQKTRNRDVHGFVPNVRRGDFRDIEPTYVPVFNVLAEVVRRNHPTGTE